MIVIEPLNKLVESDEILLNQLSDYGASSIIKNFPFYF